MPRVRESDKHASAAAAELGDVCFPGKGAVEDNTQVPHLSARLQLCVTERDSEVRQVAQNLSAAEYH